MPVLSSLVIFPMMLSGFTVSNYHDAKIKNNLSGSKQTPERKPISVTHLQGHPPLYQQFHHHHCLHQ